MSMSSGTPPKRSIRLHNKTRSGCATCKKRHVKCDETKPICHNCFRRGIDCVWKKKKNLREATLALYKPLTIPPPVTMDITSLRIIHHFSLSTSAAFCSDPAYSATTAIAVPQLAWGNPHLLHAISSIAALHLSRLHSGIPDSDSTNWSALASSHRRAAIAALPNATDPDAKFVTILSFTAYSISSSLKSSPENIFPLITSLHNIWSVLEGRHGHQNEDVNELSPFALNVGSDSVAQKLVHLQQIYDPSEATPCVESEEPFEFEVREAYRTAVEALCIAYPHSQTGYEGKSVLLWPALFGKKFCGLLNERKQRAL
ncbi:c6 transcription factor, partial [Moniliophthora roreri MCA 2997]